MIKPNSKKDKTPVSANLTSEQFDPLNLLLDPDNPRLSPEDKGKPQPRLIEVMIERFAISEIAESICAAGFLPLDPFIAYRDNGNTYIREGNRRLATLQLLRKPELAPERHLKTWTEFQRRLSAKTAEDIKTITVLLYPSRQDLNLLAYIGYRHVNGVLPWEAQEKAAYVAQLVEDPSVKWTYKEIADRIGSKPAYVEKLYVAHRLIEQAAEHEVKGAKDMRAKFGVLTRALQSPGIVQFLGVSFPKDASKSEFPATSSAENLKDFVRWTFGISGEEAPVLDESRDLTKWGKVLESPEAVRYLRLAKEPRFDRAYAKSSGVQEGLSDALFGAADRLEEAVPHVKEYKEVDEVRTAVGKCAYYLAQILAFFPEIAKEQGLEVGN